MNKNVVVLLLATTLVACGGSNKETAAKDNAPKAETAPVENTAPEKMAKAAPASAEQAATAPQQPAAAAPQQAAAEQPKAGMDPAVKAHIDASKAAVMALGGGLKKELVAAMEQGGPVAALDACVLKAPEVTKAVAGDKQVQIGRVSLKNRNAGNVPNEWQMKVLEDFEARKAAGEDPAKMAFHATVEEGDKKEFRFMKAIPTGPVCLACHGESLAPEVTAKLQENYPDDKATGFKPGDIRGAFWVVKPL